MTPDRIEAEAATMLVERLRSHPAALRDVVEGLRDLEARSLPEPAIEHMGRPS
jgi:hypothetical protein